MLQGFHNETESLTSLFEVQCAIIDQRSTTICAFKPSATFPAEHSEHEILCHRWAHGFQVENTSKLNYIFMWLVVDQLQFHFALNWSMKYFGKICETKDSFISLQISPRLLQIAT